jgi:hypothetical protein
VKEVGELTHEGIPQPPKMCPIPHFFGENVSRIDVLFDIEDV